MRRSRRIAVPLLASAALGACIDAPTAPEMAPPPAALSLSAEGGYDPVAGLAAAVGDASTRVIPTLTGAESVGAAFTGLAAAVSAGDAGGARSASAAARQALGALEGADPAEVAALQMVLDSADELYPAPS
ncbi:MAG TPA: hypothetical protein VHG91_17785 [Longimicrobium sp.]|nr:hypothetical protein [Longimicrobium sp.]